MQFLPRPTGGAEYDLILRLLYMTNRICYSYKVTVKPLHSVHNAFFMDLTQITDRSS